MSLMRSMTGLGIAATLALPAASETITVECWGLTFQPESFTVQVGDEIRWVRMDGNHTVTSGEDCVFDSLPQRQLDQDITRGIRLQSLAFGV